MKKTLQQITLLVFLLIAASLFPNRMIAQNITDQEILDLYDGLRVVDVSDGMDFVGLPDIGLMDQSIVPLWKDFDEFSHIITGIAVTARYVPTQRVVDPPKDYEAFRKWEGNWYNKYSPETFLDSIQNGSILVLDVSGDGDTGSIGSFNSLFYIEKGARGIVSNGGIRDTDEITKQKVPVYWDPMNRGRGIRPGRNELESVNKPITVGGVLVNPGDVIVADGDGVIVVPRPYAREVAEFAWKILENDKGGRRRMYERLGIPLDQTVEPRKRKIGN